MFDPMTLMMMASGANPGGAADPLLNPQGGMPMGGAQMPNPMGNVGGAPQQPGGMQSLGKLMQGIEAPKGVEPKFSGGVSGSQLPYVSRIEDMISPFMQAVKPQQTGQLPTLGMLLGGGGR